MLRPTVRRLHLHKTGCLPRPSTLSAMQVQSASPHTCRRQTHHLKELVTLVQVCHNDALTFWDTTIMTNEFTIFAHGVDLVQR